MPVQLNIPANCSLPELKILHLKSVKFPDGESIGRLISSCNSLDELVVNSCRFSITKNKLSVCNPKLKRLTITHAYVCRPSCYELEINTPNLVFLEYSSVAATRHSFINLNSLSEAHIYIGYGDDTAATIDLMSAISHVQSLHLTSVYFEV